MTREGRADLVSTALPRSAPTLFLDANILFEAAYDPKGTPARLIPRAKALGWRVVTAASVAAEARKAIDRQRSTARAGLEAILAGLELVEPEAAHHNAANQVGLVRHDRHVLAGALAAQADVLLTHDRDFADFRSRNLHGLRVLHAHELWGEWARPTKIG
jgi:predicted nucleic acid-binding protein